MDSFVNKVAESGIISLDLETFFPSENDIAIFDMKDHLFMGLILKEKEFREALKILDVSVFKGKVTGITCSTDAIIPMWAYMLVASILQPVAKQVIFGNKQQVTEKVLLENLQQIPVEEYVDKRIVIKGCGEKLVGEAAYLTITAMLRPVAKSIMYGEPCSTVPIYKKPLVRN